MRVRRIAVSAVAAVVLGGVSASPIGVTNAAAAPIGATSNWVLVARLYDGVGYTGKEFPIYVPYGCTARTTDKDWGTPTLRFWDQNWDNRVGSVRTYNGCDVKLHQFEGFTGQATGWIDNNSDLRYYSNGWNNRASSLELS